MATYSENTSIKIQAPISQNGSASLSASTLYSCPANSYAIVTLQIAGVASGVIKVGGKVFMVGPGGVGFTLLTGVYVGPGQTVVIEENTGGSVTGFVSGVEFKNSP